MESISAITCLGQGQEPSCFTLLSSMLTMEMMFRPGGSGQIYSHLNAVDDSSQAFEYGEGLERGVNEKTAMRLPARRSILFEETFSMF
jgi:hypothetical protein